MAVLEILKYPHPTLKKRSKEVDQIDEEVKKLIEDMTETMYEADGVGLAACQVGAPRRIIVVDVSPIDPQQSFFAMINPEVISEEGEIDHEEGCLSVPDCLEKVRRKDEDSCQGNFSGREGDGSGRGGDTGDCPATRNRSHQWYPHSGQSQSSEKGDLPE